MINRAIDFERSYMNGGGGNYDGNDSIPHYLFRSFIRYLYKHLKEDVASVVLSKSKGLCDDSRILLKAGENFKYVLPNSSVLCAIEFHGSAKVRTGTSLGSFDVGEIESGESGAVLNLGFRKLDEIWLVADSDVFATPIIYKR